MSMVPIEPGVLTDDHLGGRYLDLAVDVEGGLELRWVIDEASQRTFVQVTRLKHADLVPDAA